MTRTVNIGGEAVKLSAMAVVDKCYWDVFHEDPVAIQDKTLSNAEAIDFVTKMGFIMAKFAELGSYREMKALSEDDYAEWLCKFDRAALLNALPAIQAVYNGQAASAVEAKKKDVELSAG